MSSSKQRSSAFANCNPIVNFAFFIAILILTIFFMQPVLLGISFVVAVVYAIYLKGMKAVKFSLIFLLPFMLMAAIFNPLFNHNGVTMLFYVYSNPITLEAIVYGLAAALMLGAVIQWFSCYNTLITSDKFIYLFGKIIPALSLIISMSLRFISRYKIQIARISASQRGLGRDVRNGNILAKAHHGLAILSIMVTWALENGVETSDSMYSRGYGLPGRTAYSNYRFDLRDGVLLGLIAGLTTVIIAGIATSTVFIQYNPMILINDVNIYVILIYLAYAGLCVIPLALDMQEDMTWRKLRKNVRHAQNARTSLAKTNNRPSNQANNIPTIQPSIQPNNRPNVLTPEVSNVLVQEGVVS